MPHSGCFSEAWGSFQKSGKSNILKRRIKGDGFLNYGKFTQGSVLEGLRSDRYPGKKCTGVIITARCDIEQCKVSKFYYLTAMDVRTWLDSEGLLFAAERKQISKFRTLIHDFGDRVPGLKDHQNASFIDIDKVTDAVSTLPHDQTKKVLERLDEIKQLTTEDCEVLSRIPGVKNFAQKQLAEIFDDKINAYCFIPQTAYMDKVENPNDGLIVNLLDINFLEPGIVRMIERQEMDFDRLNKEQLDEYRQLFFLEKPGDMIFPERAVDSPFLEHLMQAFSFAFIRIGIDFDRQVAKNYWEEQFKKEPKGDGQE